MKNLKPITRHEQFLQDIADGEVDLKPITRQEYFLAKIAESGGGGGSSLPEYTDSDLGKMLTVGEKTKTVVVVPEQTVTISEEQAIPVLLTGYDIQFFESAVVGTEIEATDNGNTATLTAMRESEEFPGLMFRANDVPTRIVFLTSDFASLPAGLYYTGIPGSHVVTASGSGEPTPSAMWAAPSTGIYRFQLNVTTPRDVLTAWNSGKVVAMVDALDALNSISSFRQLNKMRELNGTYTAYFISVNNDLNGVNVYSVTSTGINDPFQTL